MPIEWTEAYIKNKEGVVVINKFPKPPPIKVKPRVYVRSPKTGRRYSSNERFIVDLDENGR